jgi:hypothetical protein
MGELSEGKLPSARGQFSVLESTPEALERLARGAQQPRETAKRISNPGRVAARGDLRTAFGVRDLRRIKPRVGAVAPTRGYRLQRLRRTRVWKLATGNWNLPVPPTPTFFKSMTSGGAGLGTLGGRKDEV